MSAATPITSKVSAGKSRSARRYRVRAEEIAARSVQRPFGEPLCVESATEFVGARDEKLEGMMVEPEVPLRFGQHVRCKRRQRHRLEIEERVRELLRDRGR